MQPLTAVTPLTRRWSNLAVTMLLAVQAEVTLADDKLATSEPFSEELRFALLTLKLVLMHWITPSQRG